MTVADGTLSNCDLEPIHAPGTIQPFGALVAADAADDAIRVVSGNVEAIVGRGAAGLLGHPLRALLGEEQLGRLKQRTLDPSASDALRPFTCTIESDRGDAKAFDCLVHAHGGFTILELFDHAPFDMPAADAERFRRRFVSELGRHNSELQIARVLAPLFRFFTGFDRVLVYRFHEDWHGEVIAEDTEHPERFLGLHFPDTDIPRPAREAYRLNPVRLIADVTAEPVALLAETAGAGRGFDLTFSKLRSVAPTHVQYLENMGVRSTFSVSLLVEGELWGLIACHHYAPRTPPPAQVQLCDVIVQMAAGFIERASYARRLRKLSQAHGLSETLEARSREVESLRAVIEASAADLGRLVAHDGLPITIEDQGSVVDGDGIAPELFAPLAQSAEHGVLMARRFSDLISLPAVQRQRCAGGVFLALSDDASEYLVLMRRPYPHVVSWGGRPDRQGQVDSQGVRHLEPRSSFAAWQERFDDVCAPFDADDLEVLRVLRGTLARLRAGERERAAREAQRAFEQKETELRMQLLYAARISSMHELGSAFAHELNQPLTAVMNYVAACRELIRPHEQNLPDELATLMEDGLAQAERAGAIVQRLRGLIEKGELKRRRIDLTAVVARSVDLVVPIQQADDIEIRTELDRNLMPIFADPVQIQQVIFNLMRNAIEAMAESRVRILTLGTGTSDEDTAEVWVRDTGSGLPEEISGELFRPLISTKASGMGIGLSLCRSIVEAHGGTIVARNWGAGAEFRFTLPIFPVGG